MEYSLFNDISDSVLTPQERARINARDLGALERALGYTFNDRGLLEEALCHSSFANEHGLYFSNERLEYLGDAILSFVVARALFRMYPEAREGELTQMRARLVRGESLSRRAEELKIPRLILHGRSMKDDALPASICADAVEALLGAVCLDGGIASAEKVIKRLFLRNSGEQSMAVNPKSMLQMWLQERGFPLPHYELIEVTGPSHAPVFQVSARVNGFEHTASGTTRRGAEAEAAAKLLVDLTEDERKKEAEKEKKEKREQKEKKEKKIKAMETEAEESDEAPEPRPKTARKTAAAKKAKEQKKK